MLGSAKWSFFSTSAAAAGGAFTQRLLSRSATWPGALVLRQNARSPLMNVPESTTTIRARVRPAAMLKRIDPEASTSPVSREGPSSSTSCPSM